MKWKTFKEKMPITGSNIIVKDENNKIGMVEFGPQERHFIKYVLENNGATDGNKDALCITFFEDNPEDDEYIGVECAKKWIYPSELSDQ